MRTNRPWVRVWYLLAAANVGAILVLVTGLAMLAWIESPDKLSALTYEDHLTSWIVVAIPACVTVLLPVLLARLTAPGRLDTFVRLFETTAAFSVVGEPSLIDGGVRRAREREELQSAHSLSRLTVVDELLERADRLRAANHGLLFLVVLVLIGTAAFVVFAGQVAGKDTQSLDGILTAKKSLEEQEEVLRGLEEAMASFKTKFDSLAFQLNSKGLPEAQKERLQVDIVGAKAALDRQGYRIDRAKQEYTRRQSILMNTEQALQPRGAGDERSASNLLIAAGLSRIGILVVTFYLVRILIELYRYNAQLASQCFTQANALLLMGESAADIGEMMTKLKFTLGFSRPDGPLSEKLIDKVSEMVTAGFARANAAGAKAPESP